MIFLWILCATGIGYASLAVWRTSISAPENRAVPLVIAFAAMSFWALTAVAGSQVLATIGQLARTLAWLSYLAFSTRGERGKFSFKSIQTELLLAGIAVIAAVATLGALGSVDREHLAFWIIVELVARLLVPIGGVIYLHSLLNNAPAETSSGFRLVGLGLAILWAYDLNLYTVSLLGYDVAPALNAGRSLVALLLVPAFGIAARRREHWKIAFSRKVTFQSLSLIAVGLYFVVMSLSARTISLLSGASGATVAIAVTVGLCTLGAVVLLVPRNRAWLKVMVTKHLFSHRYDYRTEWLRFSSTIADASNVAQSIEERVVQAIAQVTESPSGLLLQPARDGQFEIAAIWRWPNQPADLTATVAMPAAMNGTLQDGHIATFSTDFRWNVAGLDPVRPDTPYHDAWVAVPLIRLESLIGVVILSKPTLPRDLDWEDFDLLKAIAQQAAVHISDTQNRIEIEEARRFEEFNRRFSFIIHDIKNIVSQLSLVASNAEQHGANPKFQAEMQRSLTSAVRKMTQLLSKLSPERVFEGGPLGAVDVDRLVASIIAARAGQHPFLCTGTAAGAQARGDLTKLKLAIEHLVQNAVEASATDVPVEIAASTDAGRCLIAITDHAAGMSAEFIRKGLFKPFVSTKGGGFGIGAAEAKALIEDMGGKLRVASVEGAGTTFTIDLPLIDLRE